VLISRTSARLFFQLTTQRSEQAFTVLTSNKGFESLSRRRTSADTQIPHLIDTSNPAIN
jgi:hypothetical protein